MQEIKTSVLMAVCKTDNASFLKSALQSIYDDQTRKPQEVVVVFDGPLTEELYAVLEAFRRGKEEIVRYYPQKENRGLGEALRIGSEVCTGDYIFRMDADDISHPQRFARQLAYLREHPECDVVGTDIAEFQESLQEQMRVRSCPADAREIVWMAKHRNPMNHVSACIRREALLNCGGYQTLLLLEDYYLWLRMIAQGCQLANIQESLVYVRVGNGFLKKRHSNNRVKGWVKLQKFMLEHNMISWPTAALNMVYITAFVYSPAGLKNVFYNRFLRKKTTQPLVRS